MVGLTWMADVEIYQVTFDIHSALGRCISHLTNLMTIVTALCCSGQSQKEKSEPDESFFSLHQLKCLKCLKCQTVGKQHGAPPFMSTLNCAPNVSQPNPSSYDKSQDLEGAAGLLG